jgi:hypothetical protein
MTVWFLAALLASGDDPHAPLRVLRWIPCARSAARPPVVVVPYLVHLYGWDALKTYAGTVHHANVIADVRAYLEWYLARRRGPDRYGLVGTVDDHLLTADGRVEPLGRYDSADAYAATFLLLVDGYVTASGDTLWFRRRLGALREVAYLIATLVDPVDGLTRAVPDGAKYLMDNVEAYAGLTLFARRLRAYDPREARYYESFAQALRRALARELYDPYTGLYAWAKDQAGLHRPDLRRFYPDAYAQLFPAFIGLAPARLGRRLPMTASLPCEQQRVVGWWRVGWRWIASAG